MRKASRTLNWYFCLRSIVRVCCEMVKKKNNEAGFFIVIFKRKILTCFIHFTKKCTRYL